MAKGKPAKQPNSKFDPKIQKLPKHLEVYSDDHKVFWSFALFDSDLRLPNAGKPTDCFHDIATALKNCEKRSWQDIEGNHKRDHPIDVDDLAKFAQDRLVQLQLDDIDVIWSIHFDGKCRLWAIRNQTLLQVLWLDPEHEICPSYKKHT
jgi:hypothetical protein